MSAFLASIGLPEIVAALMVLALNAYVLMGGADFGGGLWDLLASGPRRDAQRALIADSIAPIWEANHVWLIVVVVVLFTGFPVAFATLGTVLHIPISLMLIGIVVRGSAFVFRSYGTRERGKRWGTAFAVTSFARSRRGHRISTMARQATWVQPSTSTISGLASASPVTRRTLSSPFCARSSFCGRLRPPP